MSRGRWAAWWRQSRGRRWLPAVAALALLGSPPAHAADPAQAPRVVVLYPDNNDSRPGGVAVDTAIRSTFAAGWPGPVEIDSEYLDISRFTGAEYRQQLAEFLRHKYAGRKIDVVIAGMASALDFAIEYRGRIFPGTPIVFCAVDERELKARRLPADVIGAPMKMELAPTLDLALRLHPGTERVYVVAGKAKVDTYWEGRAREAFRPYEGRLEFVYLTGLPMGDLVNRVSGLPDRSLIYYLHIFQDGAGKTFVPAAALEQVSVAANAPVYSHVDTYVGKGAVGGRVFSFYLEGKNAANLGLKILAGQKVGAMATPPVTESIDMFDWRQLRRWGIREGALPPRSEVRDRQPTFWDEYKWHIVGVVSLCVLEGLLIVGLLVQWANRRRAELRFRQVVEAAPTGMIMVARDGGIVLANAHMESLFGYPKDELLGRPVEELLPERFRKAHPADRDRFFVSPAVRAMGLGRELFGLRKDRSEFPLEVGLSPVRIGTDLFVLASVVDISQRKEAEVGLHESQRELRLLTGRLLQAQETERRRIARELHDDINQALALLAVEMDLLGQMPPDAAGELRGRVQALSDRVKELSSSVHGLSHHLHPAKLEQLGLVTAVGGLCRELTEAHGLPIAFTAEGVPAAVPEDTALCLYRIAQEALRNVLRHSGARQAAVGLTGDGARLCLHVSDDGSGFDPRSADGRGGLGLVSMRERLRLVGGSIAIHSRPEGGTRIDVCVPLSAAAANGALHAPTEPVG